MKNKKKTLASVEMPSAVQYEASLLGVLILQNHCYLHVKDFLDVDDFYNELYQSIYKCIRGQAENGDAFDARTITEQLFRLVSDSYSEDDLFNLLLDLCGKPITGSAASEYIKVYARKIKDASLRRKEILLFQRKIARLSDLDEPRAVILEDSLQEITQHLEKSSEPSAGLVAWDFTEFLQADIPPREMMLEPFMTRSSLTMLFGHRGTGKSWISSEIAFAVASGGSFLQWRARQPFGVLLLDGEMPDQSLQERFLKITQSRKIYPQKPLVIISPDRQLRGMPDLSTIEGQRLINQSITADIDLVIVDNLSTLSRTGKENEAESWLPLQSWALKLRAQGKAVLFIHHASRGGAARGTSKREDILDTVIKIERPKDYTADKGAVFEVSFEKARNFKGHGASSFIVELIDEPGNFSWHVKSTEQDSFEKILKLKNDGMSVRDISLELGMPKSTVQRHLKYAEGVNLYKNKGTNNY